MNHINLVDWNISISYLHNLFNLLTTHFNLFVISLLFYIKGLNWDLIVEFCIGVLAAKTIEYYLIKLLKKLDSLKKTWFDIDGNL